MKTDYDTQAEQFLASNGLKIRITLSDTKTSPWADGKACHTCKGTGKQEKGWPMGRPGKCSFCNGTGTKIEKRHHYRVTLSRTNRDSWTKNTRRKHPNYAGEDTPPKRAARLTFDFWGSINDADKGFTPAPYDVLACISSDAYTPETFADWCSEYGDSPDSLKALQTFRRCHAFAKRLHAFFTPAELSHLVEIR